MKRLEPEAEVLDPPESVVVAFPVTDVIPVVPLPLVEVVDHPVEVVAAVVEMVVVDGPPPPPPPKHWRLGLAWLMTAIEIAKILTKSFGDMFLFF